MSHDPATDRIDLARDGEDRDVPPPASELIGTLAGLVLADESLSSVLEHITTFAKRTVPGTVEASVTLIEDGKPGTIAYSGRLALALDERQYDAGHGPCLDAARTGDVSDVGDTSKEARWPEFMRAAVAAGVRSSLSVPLSAKQRILGALNMYSSTPRAFDQQSAELVRTFASYAAVALTNTQLYTSTVQLADDMQHAMESRAVIEQAKGILIASRFCTAEEAFAILVDMSQRSNRKLREVAAGLVEMAQKRPGKRG
jgi:GAF domain-containing protein